jgi:hypothetical protein
MSLTLARAPFGPGNPLSASKISLKPARVGATFASRDDATAAEVCGTINDIPETVRYPAGISDNIPGRDASWLLALNRKRFFDRTDIRA